MGDLDDLAAASRPNQINPPSHRRVQRPPPKKSGVPTWVWVVGVLFVVGLIGKAIQGPHDAAVEASKAAETEQHRQVAAELRLAFDKQVSIGNLHSVDYDNGILRVNPVKWAMTDIEAKRTLIVGFHKCVSWSGKGFAVEIRSSKNETVLGSWVGLGEIKIER